MAKKQQQPVEEPKTLIRKYYDKVGRLVTVVKDKFRKYTIQVQLFDRKGKYMLVNKEGISVAMLCYTFKDRKSCMKELHDKYPRENKIDKE